MTTWIIIGLLIVILVMLYLMFWDMGRRFSNTDYNFEYQKKDFASAYSSFSNGIDILNSQLSGLESDIQRLKDEVRDISSIVHRKLNGN